MSEVMIRVEGLYKLFGPVPERHMGLVHEGVEKDEILARTGHTLGLKDINLTIDRGEVFVIMGLSGSGKSTLIRHFNRLIDPTEGRILIDGVDVLGLSTKELERYRREKMSMVFQHFGLMPHRTVLQNVAYGLQVQGISGAVRNAKAGEWLDAVGLSGYGAQYPAQLSGGQQQRVGLARALCTDADILLMDEAFSALDPLIRNEMQDQLVELQERLHKTIIFITHDLDEALRLGDRIAILKDGEVVQVGTPQEILLRPADDYVEAFVRDVNRARALTVETVMKPPARRITADTIGEALLQMRKFDGERAYIIDDDGYRGVVLRDELEQHPQEDASESIDCMVIEVPAIAPDDPLENVIPETLNSDLPLPVIDADGDLQGELSREELADVLGRTETDGVEEAKAATG